MIIERFYQNQGASLKYYEIENSSPPLLLIHAQGVDGSSFPKDIMCIPWTAMVMVAVYTTQANIMWRI